MDLQDSPPPPLTHLREDERAIQTMVKEFATSEIAPRVRAMDEAQRMDPDLVAHLFALDLMGIEVPEPYGGLGSTFFVSILVIEALATVDPAVSVLVDVQNTLVVNAIQRWGNDAQKERFLPKLCKDTVGSYALSEASSGSDAFSLRCRATPVEGGYRLNGSKLWITSAQEAGLYLVFATVNPDAGYRGITAFLVERDTPGFSLGKKEDKLGIRASSTCELVFEDAFVPADGVLGEVGKGYKIAIEALNEGRIGIAAQMLGLAEGAHAAALAYAKTRVQFGQPIFNFQLVQGRLAEMATRIEAARLLTYNAARLKDAKLPFIKEAAMAKWYASQVAEFVASESLELFGGYGFTKDYPAEKFLRDSKVGKIYEGTSFMQLQTIAKLL